MSDLDAYEDVGWIFRLDGELERVLAGEGTEDERLRGLDDFVDELKHAYLRPPDDLVASRHLEAVVAAASCVAGQAVPLQGPALGKAPDAVDASARRLVRRRLMHRRKGVLKLALAAAALVVSATGALAASGVVDIPVLPDRAAERAKEAVASAPLGGERDQRPEEAAPPPFVGTLLDAIESTPPEERGCEFGRRVATIASGSDPTDGNACSQAERRNGADRASRRENRGKNAGSTASGGVSAQAQAGQVSGGKQVGDQASGGIASQAPAGQVSGGKQVGDQASGGVSGHATEQAPTGGAPGGAGGASPAPGGAAGAGAQPSQAGVDTAQQAAKAGQAASGQAPGPGGRP